MRTLLYLTFTFVCFFVNTPSKSGDIDDSKNCVLVFGFTEWKPLQYVDDNGLPTGIQIDLSKAVLEELGCELKYEFGTWSNSLAKIKTGEIDFTANATETSERKNYGLFSAAYRRDEFTIFVRHPDKKKFEKYSISELKKSNFRLGLTRNYLYGEEVEQWQSDEKYNHLLSYVDHADDNLDKLFKGEIDGVLFDPFEVAYKLRSKDLSQRIVSLPIRTFGREVSFIFSKKRFDDEFIQRFNKALKKIVNDPKNQSLWINNNL